MKTLIIIAFTIHSCVAIGQTISFRYDDSGNRTLRDLAKSIVKSNGISEDNDQLPILKSLDESTICIYPNPTKGILLMEVTKLEGECITFFLADLNGKVLLEKEISEPSTTIDISDKSSGTYILRIKSGAEYAEWKIIKQ